MTGIDLPLLTPGGRTRATHPYHRRVWAEQAATIDVFITNRHVPKGEKSDWNPSATPRCAYSSRSTPRPGQSPQERTDMARLTDAHRTRNEAAVRAAGVKS